MACWIKRMKWYFDRVRRERAEDGSATPPPPPPPPGGIFPVITSNGGNATAAISAAEGQTAVTIVTATGTALGTLELSTRPAMVDAFIDGTRRGSTPLVVPLDAGTHTVELRGAGKPRRIQLTINPGMKVSQYVDLTAASRTKAGRASVRQR